MCKYNSTKPTCLRCPAGACLEPACAAADRPFPGRLLGSRHAGDSISQIPCILNVEQLWANILLHSHQQRCSQATTSQNVLDRQSSRPSAPAAPAVQTQDWSNFAQGTVPVCACLWRPKLSTAHGQAWVLEYTVWVILGSSGRVHTAASWRISAVIRPMPSRLTAVLPLPAWNAQPVSGIRSQSVTFSGGLRCPVQRSFGGPLTLGLPIARGPVPPHLRESSCPYMSAHS